MIILYAARDMNYLCATVYLIRKQYRTRSCLRASLAILSHVSLSRFGRGVQKNHGLILIDYLNAVLYYMQNGKASR